MRYDGYSDILVEQDGFVLRISHNRPTRRNAESELLLAEMDDVLAQSAQDDSVRVLVIGGEGSHFSAGHDVHEGMAKRGDFDAAQTWTWELEHYYGNAMRIWDHPKPTIAEVRGACIAGGFMVANSCDLLIASEDAFFSDPVLHSLGVCGVEVLLHPWVMGLRKAKEFLYCGTRISAQDALDLGIANQIVPTEVLRETTMSVAHHIAKAPPVSIRMMKRSLNRTADIMGYRSSVSAHFDTHVLAQTGPEAKAIAAQGMGASIKRSKTTAAISAVGDT